MMIEYIPNDVKIEGSKLPDWLSMHYDEITYTLFFTGTPKIENIG